MGENYDSILEAAQRLTGEEQRRLAAQLLTAANGADKRAAAGEGGNARLHFGAWDSGDERSADNERIDRDLAHEYGDPHQP